MQCVYGFALCLLILGLAFHGVGGKAANANLSATAGKKLPTSGSTGIAKLIAESRDHLIAGAVARGVSIFLLYPLDTLKTRYQLSAAAKAHLQPLTLPLLYKGVIGSLCGQVPYGMLSFGLYETFKANLSRQYPAILPELISFVSAILGDMVGSFWLCPSETIKQQLQGGVHASFGLAVSHIWSSKGAKGFYAGYFAQIARDIPFRAISLPTFEACKRFYLRMNTGNAGNNSVAALRPLESMVIGGIAGSFTSALTTPLDVIKTRIMASAGGAADVSLSKVLSTATEIAGAEGMRGLFSGIGPRVLYVGPSVGIFFVVYEATKQHLAQLRKAKRAASTLPNGDLEAVGDDLKEL